MSARAMVALSGSAAGDALGERDDIRDDVEVLRCEHLAGASHAALDFVEDQQDAVAVGDAAQFVEELLGRDEVAAFALDRFDHDRGDFFGWKNGAEKRVLDGLRAFDGAGVDRLAVGAAVAIGVGDVVDAGHHREEVLALAAAAAGERQRPHGAPVECAVERDELLAAGVIAGQLDGGLDGLGAGVAEVDLRGHAAGRQGGQLLGQVHHVLVVEVGARHVDQAGGLALDGFDHLWDGNGRWRPRRCRRCSPESDCRQRLRRWRLRRGRPPAGRSGCRKGEMNWASRSMIALALGPGSGVTRFGSPLAMAKCMISLNLEIGAGNQLIVKTLRLLHLICTHVLSYA